MSQPPSYEPRRRRPASKSTDSTGEVPPRRRPSQPTRRVEKTQGSGATGAAQPGPRRVSTGTPQANDDLGATRVDGSGYGSGYGTTPPSYPPAGSGSDRARQGDQQARNSRPTQPNPNQAAARNEAVAPPQKPKKKRGFWRTLLILVLVLLFVVLGWVIYLLVYGNSLLHHVDALSGRADTPGDTYLIVGSDERTTGSGVEGKRSDTLMLLHVPEQGNTALISIPRDSYVVIPGQGNGKINSAFSIGGPQLAVATVENLTGLTVDHYVQIGMDGVEQLTDAVGGINLCYDQSFSDSYAKLDWEAGCHDVDGETALKFSRMRYSDPRGDIGRTERQRQVVSKIIDKAISPSTLVNPVKQRDLVVSATSVLAVSEGDNLFDLAKAGLGLRSVMGANGVTGTPPIADLNYRVGAQSVVLLDPNTIDQFWVDLANGDLTQDSFATP